MRPLKLLRSKPRFTMRGKEYKSLSVLAPSVLIPPAFHNGSTFSEYLTPIDPDPQPIASLARFPDHPQISRMNLIHAIHEFYDELNHSKWPYLLAHGSKGGKFGYANQGTIGKGKRK